MRATSRPAGWSIRRHVRAADSLKNSPDCSTRGNCDLRFYIERRARARYMGSVAENFSCVMNSREIRYRLSNAPSVTVVPEGDERGLTLDVHDARLLDLSRHGAKLASPTEIPTGNSIHLKLAVPKLGLVFQVAGAVCWCSLSEDDSWWMGCSLRPGLPHELLDQLAERGEVNRRLDARFREEVALSAFWELGGDREPAHYGTIHAAAFASFPSDRASRANVFI